MRTSADVLGKMVVLGDPGTRLGSVQDLLFSEDQGRVLGFLVKSGMFGESTIIPFGDVLAFGPDALVVRAPASDAPREWPASRSHAVNGKRVMTRDGRDLGVIRDLHFSEDTGDIVGYELAKNAMAGLLPRRFILPADASLTVGPEVVMVAPEAADLLERKDEAVKRFGEETDE